MSDMSTTKKVEVAILLGRITTDILSGDRSDAAIVARQLASIASGLVPVEELRGYLTEHDRSLIDTVVDASEAVKLAGET